MPKFRPTSASDMGLVANASDGNVGGAKRRASSAVGSRARHSVEGAALATLLADRGERSGRLSIDQGESIGAPSRIELEWSGGTAAIGGTVAHDGTRPLDI